MKNLQIGELNVKVCGHQGDINYLRFVKFKQYAPQFWEKMDSPLWAAYFERYRNYHDKGEHARALMVLHDYNFALDNSKNSYDAWGMCFALIVILDGEDERSCPDDAQLKSKLKILTDQGLNAETVKTEVINFMKASPEVFTDHLIMHGIASIPSDIS